MKFIPRDPELLKIEGKYGNIELSCRHKTILKCSTSKHFKSCFTTNFKRFPIKYCADSRIAVIGIRDKSGQFMSRAFIVLAGIHRDKIDVEINRIYGNGLDKDMIRKELCNVMNITFRDRDLLGF